MPCRPQLSASWRALANYHCAICAARARSNGRSPWPATNRATANLLLGPLVRPRFSSTRAHCCPQNNPAEGATRVGALSRRQCRKRKRAGGNWALVMLNLQRDLVFSYSQPAFNQPRRLERNHGARPLAHPLGRRCSIDTISRLDKRPTVGAISAPSLAALEAPSNGAARAGNIIELRLPGVLIAPLQLIRLRSRGPSRRGGSSGRERKHLRRSSGGRGGGGRISILMSGDLDPLHGGHRGARLESHKTLAPGHRSSACPPPSARDWGRGAASHLVGRRRRALVRSATLNLCNQLVQFHYEPHAAPPPATWAAGRRMRSLDRGRHEIGCTRSARLNSQPAAAAAAVRTGL